MEKLEILLQKINFVGYQNIPNQEKHKILSILWENVWNEIKDSNFPLEEVYNTYLCNESTSFLINQPPIIKKVDIEKVKEALFHFEKHRYFTQEEVYLLLDWSINNARLNIEKLGVFIANNSLNGYCELGQLLTIMPFEKIGLSVTKNTTHTSFLYPYDHAFGTVTFPVLLGTIVLKSYLIDVTYRQFFTTIRCNEGMYFTKEAFDLPHFPAPGYFVKDKKFAKKLMADGYILLTEQNAKKYGEPFYKCSLEKGENTYFKGNYLKNILEKKEAYLTKDIEELNIEFPYRKSKKL